MVYVIIVDVDIVIKVVLVVGIVGLYCCCGCCCWGQEEIGRAQILILHGHQLASSHHYAMALIVQRCNELRHHCDTLSASLRAKHTHLAHTHQLLLRLDQVEAHP